VKTRHRLTIAGIDRMKDPLRQAVSFQEWEGKLSILHLVTGIPGDKLRDVR
jgi:hypothetical protein